MSLDKRKRIGYRPSSRQAGAYGVKATLSAGFRIQESGFKNNSRNVPPGTKCTGKSLLLLRQKVASCAKERKRIVQKLGNEAGMSMKTKNRLPAAEGEAGMLQKTKVVIR
jgi:hypothetical protein